ncbi:MAG: hypothetical protein ACLRQF_04025 [Thomasclavelia ramosa]
MMEATYHILDLQENKDIFAIYMSLILINKTARIGFENKAEHDGLTGLYNRSKAINEINRDLA